MAAMETLTVKDEIDRLRVEMAHHDRLYYRENRPQITDLGSPGWAVADKWPSTQVMTQSLDIPISIRHAGAPGRRLAHRSRQVNRAQSARLC